MILFNDAVLNTAQHDLIIDSICCSQKCQLMLGNRLISGRGIEKELHHFKLTIIFTESGGFVL